MRKSIRVSLREVERGLEILEEPREEIKRAGVRRWGVVCGSRKRGPGWVSEGRQGNWKEVQGFRESPVSDVRAECFGKAGCREQIFAGSREELNYRGYEK